MTCKHEILDWEPKGNGYAMICRACELQMTDCVPEEMTWQISPEDLIETWGEA